IFRLAGWLADYYCAPLGEVLGMALAASLQPPKRTPAEAETEEFSQGIIGGLRHWPPTEQQAAVLAELEKLAAADGKRVALLKGPAATGKTEVYLQLAGRLAEAGGSQDSPSLGGPQDSPYLGGPKDSPSLGGQSLILVPEIALAPQVESWARERFGEKAAVLHSRLSRSRHYRIFRDAAAGRISVVIGTRSAVFTPFARLKLIVVDEEFDRSYKETRQPRYHAREAALKRGELAGALVLLVSATPALETWRAAGAGEIRSFTLTERIGRLELPKIYISDLRAGPADGRGRRSEKGLVSPRLLSLLEERLLKGEQSIIFVNRRGYTTYLFCPNCGQRFTCPTCAVNLVFHRTTGELYCHYCNYRREPPPACPACGAVNLGRRAAGTQALERELQRRLPDAAIVRLDSDTLSRSGGLAELEKFRSGRAQILIGTQMITKGHHFPGVTLAAVLGADNLLNRPDFRAAERYFQLLFQLAGRAGRSLPNAEVLIQTGNPEHYALTALAAYDLEGFYRQELEYRRELGYPPFGRLANLVFSGRKEETAERKARAWLELLTPAAERLGVELLGPAACYHKKLRNRYRWHLLLKSGRPGDIPALLNSLPEKRLYEGGLTLDLDPVDLF
ncbi:MAG TPA: primosomal protein N', partial [bacterium]|nr:primosomal protein N' [bacterium]HNS49347.1 primosomal protein N' [bacterium]